MTRLHKLWLIVVVLLALSTPARTGQEGARRTIDELVDDLGSIDLKAAEAAEKELHRELTQLSKSLLRIIAETPKREKSLGEPAHACDRALAVLRTKRDDPGINRFLMKNICWFDNGPVGVSFTAGYPCATLLSGLGPTAAYEIVHYLERPPEGADLSDGAINMFARVFVTIYSDNGGKEEAQAMLTRAQRRAKNTEHIDRLQKAIREFGVKKPPPPVPSAP